MRLRYNNTTTLLTKRVMADNYQVLEELGSKYLNLIIE